MAAPNKEAKVTLEKDKDTKRFTKYAIVDENGTADITGALYVRKGTDLSGAEKLVLQIAAK